MTENNTNPEPTLEEMQEQGLFTGNLLLKVIGSIMLIMLLLGGLALFFGIFKF